MRPRGACSVGATPARMAGASRRKTCLGPILPTRASHLGPPRSTQPHPHLSAAVGQTDLCDAACRRGWGTPQRSGFPAGRLWVSLSRARSSMDRTCFPQVTLRLAGRRSPVAAAGWMPSPAPAPFRTPTAPCRVSPRTRPHKLRVANRPGWPLEHCVRGCPRGQPPRARVGVGLSGRGSTARAIEVVACFRRRGADGVTTCLTTTLRRGRP